MITSHRELPDLQTGHGLPSRAGRFDLHTPGHDAAPVLEVLPAGLPLARRIDRFHRGNAPATK